jgi:hypothetical protein
VLAALFSNGPLAVRRGFKASRAMYVRNNVRPLFGPSFLGRQMAGKIKLQLIETHFALRTKYCVPALILIRLIRCFSSTQQAWIKVAISLLPIAPLL